MNEEVILIEEELEIDEELEEIEEFIEAVGDEETVYNEIEEEVE